MTTKHQNSIEHYLKPHHLLGLVFAILLTVSGLVLSLVALPQNQDPTSFASGNDSIQNCNQACHTNRDCAVNLRCYHGVCRLADNPESLNCQLVSITTTPSPQPTISLPPATATPTLTITPTIKPTRTSTSSGVPTPTAGVQVVKQSVTTTPETKLITLSTIWKQPKYRLPLISFIIGLGLIIVALLIRNQKASRQASRSTTKTINQVMAPSVRTEKPQVAEGKTSSMTERLKHKQIRPPKK